MRKVKSILLIIFITMLILFLFVYITKPLTCTNYWNDLGNADIVLGYLVTCFTIALGIIAWFRRQDIRSWFRKRQFINVGLPFDIPKDKIQAIIAPVSSHGIQAQWILECLKPKYASLLYTEQSRNKTLEIIQEYSNKGIQFFPNFEAVQKNESMVDDVFNPQKSKGLTKEFLYHYNNKGISLSKIFVDTTGGTVPMSIGAFQAAEE